jgi:hypothetical protein
LRREDLDQLAGDLREELARSLIRRVGQAGLAEEGRAQLTAALEVERVGLD